MTAQIPDQILVDGRWEKLFTEPSAPLAPGRSPESTACRRGYRARWLVENGWLVLVSVSGLDLKVPLPAKASWFSGTLRIPQGRLLCYAHSGYDSRYEREVLLDIIAGRVVQRRYRHRTRFSFGMLVVAFIAVIVAMELAQIRDRAIFIASFLPLGLAARTVGPGWRRALAGVAGAALGGGSMVVCRQALVAHPQDCSWAVFMGLQPVALLAGVLVCILIIGRRHFEWFCLWVSSEGKTAMRGYGYLVQESAAGSQIIRYPDFPEASVSCDCGSNQQADAREGLLRAIEGRLRRGEGVPPAHFVPDRGKGVTLGESVMVADWQELFDHVVFHLGRELERIAAAKSINSGLAECRRQDPETHRLILELLFKAAQLNELARTRGLI